MYTAKDAKAAKTDFFKTEGNEGLTKESCAPLTRFPCYRRLLPYKDPSLWPLRPLL